MSTATRYHGEGGRVYHEGKRSIPEIAFPWVAESRARKFRRFVKAADVVLEYGVGYGWNLAKVQCARKVGFDVAEFLQEGVEKRGIEFIRDTSALPDGFADVVICHHTLEHVMNPAETLQEIQRLMKDSATLLLTVPYEKERRYRKFNPFEPNHHLYSWNPQSLGNLLEASRFQAESIVLRRYNYDRFAAKHAAVTGSEAVFRLLQALTSAFRPQHEVMAVARKKA